MGLLEPLNYSNRYLKDIHFISLLRNGFILEGNSQFNAFGGNSNGDKHRPNFGEMHAVLAHAVLDASDAKQLGLSSFVSLDAGDEERASKLMARNGLDAREKWNNDCSLVDVLRPSGPNARICGDEPRCA